MNLDQHVDLVSGEIEMKICIFSSATVQLISFQSDPKKDVVSGSKVKEYCKSFTIVEALVCVKMMNF